MSRAARTQCACYWCRIFFSILFKPHERHHMFCRVIDVLPKQWGRALAADYLQQLCDKEDFHQTFLTTLEEIDVMRFLDPEALR